MIRLRGWNENVFLQLETLKQKGISINLRSYVDSASVGFDILRQNKAACITGLKQLPADFYFIPIPAEYQLEIAMVACYPQRKRDSPLTQFLTHLIKNIIE
ncbi:hypothetical protein [Shewanella halifaxensis]|uniref:hypothetical protein n=1 Tax=Shewanella halifaxensis TaxID=271098 RepID=UPI00167FBFA7|nr:hypothetical protein [Shewanella halifaxensis]